MDFLNQVRDIATRIPKQIEHIQTEEATKTAFILPFIAALGYNVFDPTEPQSTPPMLARRRVKR